MRKIRGATLVSVLIGVALGTFLIVVMLQIFSATRANYKLSQNLAEMNDVLRYTSLIMTDVVSQAGYRTPNATTGVLPAYATAFPTFNSTLTGPSGTYNTGATNADDPAGVVLSYFPGQDVFISATNTELNDKLWVKFHGDSKGRITDCNNLYGVDNVAIMVRFYSRQVTVGGNSSTAYYCEEQQINTNYSYPVNTVRGTELIPAELFDTAWVRYGEDLGNKGYINRWALGGDVADRNKVYAVRVAFLIHSRDDVRTNDVTQTFYVFGQTVSRTSKKIYKLYMFTILLPNAPNYKLASKIVTP